MNRINVAQFSLRSLLELMLITALLCAASTVLGLLAALWLIILAGALWLRYGLVALCALVMAFISVDLQTPNQNDGSSFGAALLVMMAATGLCGWYGWRGNGKLLGNAIVTGARGAA